VGQSQSLSKKASKKASGKTESKTEKNDYEKKHEQARRYVKALDELGLEEEDHYPFEERRIKEMEAGGGYRSIGTIEDISANLIRLKSGNDGTYYQVNLREHINYVRRMAHGKATTLFNRLLFANTPQTSLDILRAEVDKKLVKLAPKAAEKLITAFQSVASEKPEQWSHALTSCRRFLQELANVLYPSRAEMVKGRSLNETNYINRIWAFMDSSIASASNRSLAKAHVDYLGIYLERIHKLSNKGVHSDLLQTEAIKAVFHTYLAVADILDYL
jgi:hypothetical protein